MNSGWIKLHRGLLDWEWYDDANTKILFLHCLLKANHTEKKYRGKVVKRGTFLTGRELLAEETGLTVRQVRTSLNRLKSTNELTIKSSRQGTVVEVVNYDEYQTTTNETTNERPTSDQQATSNKNEKKEKNEKKDKRDNSDAESVYAAYPRKVGKQQALKSITKALKETTADELIEHLKLYSESVKDKEAQFIPHASTYFNQGRHLEPVEIIQPAKKKMPAPWEL